MKWQISLSDIDLGEEEIEAVTNVLRSKWLTMGGITQEFEKEFAQYLGVKYAFAVSSGTAALHLAHQVLGIGREYEVICPSLTFVATANSIIYTGAIPIFADIDSLDNFNISPQSILEKITPRTKAITVVHYGGYLCDMDEIMKIAKEYGLYVIEDAAHAPGAEYKEGKKAGTIGDLGCFSFFSNKNMATGEGGMIVTNSDNFAEKIKIIRSHGMTTLTWEKHKGRASTYDVVDLGFNYRIDEIRSAMGLVQLKKLKENNKRRELATKQYQEELKDLSQIHIPFKDCVGKPSYHIFPILLSEEISRPVIMDNLKRKGIQTSIHYPPIHQFTYYKAKFNFTGQTLPKTESVSKREVTLPLYPMINSENISYISDSLKEEINNSFNSKKNV